MKQYTIKPLGKQKTIEQIIAEARTLPEQPTQDKPPITETQQTTKPPQTSKDFIRLPNLNIEISKERLHLRKNWFEAHQELQNQNYHMPTLPEFIEFLKYTKTNNPDIYEDITAVRDPWRSEWIDADFKLKNKKLYINSNHILDSNGNPIPQSSEILDPKTLMQDKTPGISLDHYLANHTTQGLPTKKTKDGNLYYWTPIKNNNSVAWFSANSGRAGLNCQGDPAGRSSNLGVRAVRRLGA